ncbi:VCBS repeat-containing protein [bacterium]|nr:VCBS repeat-containing protein [bacterium]
MPIQIGHRYGEATCQSKAKTLEDIMKNKLFCRIFSLASAVLLLGLSASAGAQITADFAINGPIGNLWSPTFVDPATGVTAEGWYHDGQDWIPANLYRRNQPRDHGLGVCSPLEEDLFGGDCPGPLGGGHWNEISNALSPEVIVFALPAGYEWVWIQVSSMDQNPDNPDGPPEMGRIWADYDGVIFNGDEVLGTVMSGDITEVEQEYILEGTAFENAPFLIFEPKDWLPHPPGVESVDNDFLAWRAAIKGGGEGCTPGYWKQTHHFGSWEDYSPGDLFDTVFGVTLFPGMTLLEVLKQGGGQEKALGRHAVAALLNSVNSGVGYDFSAAEVIAMVQDAVATGDFEDIKDMLADENESGCNLGRADNDFDGDGRADIAVYDPNTNNWSILQSAYGGVKNYTWGSLPSDLPVAGDYDGDGFTDLASYQENGTWHLARSAAGYAGLQFGSPGVINVPADYDGDGATDMAIFEPWSGVWHISRTTLGYFGTLWGETGDIPVPADYDGDGIADIAVFRPSNQTWYLDCSSAGAQTFVWGLLPTDKPVPGDYDGDGRDDIAVYQANGTWHLARTSAGYAGLQLGAPGDIPVPADYDGDGAIDMAIFQPNGVWHLSQTTEGYRGVVFGKEGDLPVKRAPDYK